MRQQEKRITIYWHLRESLAFLVMLITCPDLGDSQPSGLRPYDSWKSDTGFSVEFIIHGLDETKRRKTKRLKKSKVLSGGSLVTDNKEDPTRHRGPLFRRYWVSTKISTPDETVNWSPWFLTEGPGCLVTRQARARPSTSGRRKRISTDHAVKGPGNTRRYNFFFPSSPLWQVFS